MRAAFLLLALAGCSSALSGVAVNLTVMNATERPELVRTTIRDAAGVEYFSRTSIILPDGGEEIRPAVYVPLYSRLKVCTTLTLERHSKNPDRHHCTYYAVGAWTAECFSTAFPRGNAPPHASATCHAGEPLGL